MRSENKLWTPALKFGYHKISENDNNQSYYTNLLVGENDV